jgi:hypothetical protein
VEEGGRRKEEGGRREEEGTRKEGGRREGGGREQEENPNLDEFGVILTTVFLSSPSPILSDFIPNLAATLCTINLAHEFIGVKRMKSILCVVKEKERIQCTLHCRRGC